MPSGYEPRSRSRQARIVETPIRPRRFYLQEALLIGLTLLPAIAATYMTLARGGSILWLVGAYSLFMFACGPAAKGIWRIAGGDGWL